MAWNSDTEYALGLPRTLTRLLGIWPIDRPRYIALSRMAFGSIMSLIVMVIFIKDVISKGNCGSIVDIIATLSAIVVGMLSIIKLIIPHIYNESMCVIVYSAIYDWNNVGSKESRKIMMKYAYNGRFVFIFQMCGVSIGVLLLIISDPPSYGVIIDELNVTASFRNIPVAPNCWISPSLSESLYLAYYFLITVTLLIICMTYIGADVYIFSIAMHICGQFDVLYNNFEGLDGSDIDSVIRKNISQLTQRHCHLLMLANNFENTFNYIILMQVIANGFMIAISGILLIWGLHASDNEIVFNTIVRINVLYIQLYLYNYIGDNLMTKASNLQMAVYNCIWYKMSPSLVRDLTFIMMRNNYPFYLTAGKMFKMNLPGFQKLVKTMFSFFSVLRLMFDQ